MLLAVDYKGVAAPLRARDHLARGTARVRLGDANRGLVATQNQVSGKPLLGITAIFHHSAECAHGTLDDNTAGGATAFRNLLDHKHSVEAASTLSPIGDRYSHPHKSCIF